MAAAAATALPPRRRPPLRPPGGGGGGERAASPADADGLQLALLALDAGRRKFGAHSRCGAAIVVPGDGDASDAPGMSAVAWGCHRAMASSAAFSASCFDIHAEADAVAYAARRGVSVVGGTCYVTKPPCKACTLSLAAAGVARVAYTVPLRAAYEERTAEAVEAVAAAAGMDLVAGVPTPDAAWLSATFRGAAPPEAAARRMPPRPEWDDLPDDADYLAAKAKRAAADAGGDEDEDDGAGGMAWLEDAVDGVALFD